MNFDKKRIIKCLLVAIFMTLMLMLIKIPDFKNPKREFFENLDWKRYILYFLGIFMFYYFIDIVSKLRGKKVL